MDLIKIDVGNLAFPLGATSYLKESSNLELKSRVKPVVSHNENVIMVISKLGKGIMFAVGYPWL
jgi:hypothetical protein